MNNLKYFKLPFVILVFVFVVFSSVHFILNSFEVSIGDRSYSFLKDWSFCNFIIFTKTSFLKGISALLMLVSFYKIYSINLKVKMNGISCLIIVFIYLCCALFILKVDIVYDFFLRHHFIDECKLKGNISQRSIKILRY